ncbi:NAD(P)-dependent oxidoreductase [Chakrabartia godavariana]|nr:NAD(P)-dependent oxidoreductase [Chakrabartia godavariana]
MSSNLSLIGFGEAGSTFARAGDWAARVYDLKTDGPARAEMLARYEEAGVTGADSTAEAVRGADAVFSVVTADQALAVARAAAPAFPQDAFYFDMNSVAPDTKRAAAAVIDASGGRYVDVAVMAPVNPARMAVPLLVSGPYAEAGAALLADAGFTKVRVVGTEVGRASTIKMLRSVIFKGMEALTAECVLACDRAGVLDEVLGSLGAEWPALADYRLDRMMVHGVRRAAEMEESAKTLEALGIDPLMTRGTIARQRQIGSLNISPIPETLDAKLERLNKA